MFHALVIAVLVGWLLCCDVVAVCGILDIYTDFPWHWSFIAGCMRGRWGQGCVGCRGDGQESFLCIFSVVDI